MDHIINKIYSKITIQLDMDSMDKEEIKIWEDSNLFFNKCSHKHLVIWMGTESPIKNKINL